MAGTSARWRALALSALLAGSTAATIAQPPASQAATLPPGFTETPVSQVFAPTTMEFAPDGRLFVVSQVGAVYVVKDGILLPTPFVTLDADTQNERGAVGLALDPNFTENGWVYINYTARTPLPHQRISRFTADGDVAVPGSEQVIWDFEPLHHDFHVAGATAFGPDGKLYVALGDNGAAPQSQSLDNLFGKIIRINPDGTIPLDNPFYATATGNNRAIWALGLRNPFTFEFQPATGRFFINDVGQHTWEEINEGVPGANYGWPVTEGPTTDPQFRGPLFSYPNGSGLTAGCAITGGAFYDPQSATFPAEFLGTYLFPDLCEGWIRRLDPLTNQSVVFASGFGRIVDLEVAPDGDLYVLGHTGTDGVATLVRVTFTGAPTGRALRSRPTFGGRHRDSVDYHQP
jgi:glucose/arabinose dehydrogenase